MRLPTLLALPLLLSTTSSTPLPTTTHQKECTNHLLNPSFESPVDYPPWQTLKHGSFFSTSIVPHPSGTGTNYYNITGNSTTPTTFALAQSYLHIPGGTRVSCSARLTSRRPEGIGKTRVDVFMDGMLCGEVVELGNMAEAEWVKVGGEVVVGDVDANGGEVGHTFTVVVGSKEAGREGWSVGIDDLMVGVGC
jgi:hypothetical protein